MRHHLATPFILSLGASKVEGSVEVTYLMDIFNDAPVQTAIIASKVTLAGQQHQAPWLDAIVLEDDTIRAKMLENAIGSMSDGAARAA